MNRMMLVLGAAVVVGGCSQTPNNQTMRSEILQTAVRDYDYLAPRTPVPAAVSIVSEGVTTPEPALQIWPAKLRSSAPKESNSEVVAKVFSSEEYAPLGIPADTSYIWRDVRAPVNGNFKTWIIPQAPGLKARQLKRDERKIAYSHGQPDEPRFVKFSTKCGNRECNGFGVCTSDPACGGNHCGYGSVQ